MMLFIFFSLGCALGGNGYVLGGAHLFTPLPFLRHNVFSNNLRVHAWANAGSLVNVDLESSGNWFSCRIQNMYRVSTYRCVLCALFELSRFDHYVLCISILRCVPDIKQLGRDLQQGANLSYGLGLALNLFGIARFEVNYCIPVPLTNQNSGYVSNFVDVVTHTGYEWVGNLIVGVMLFLHGV